MNKNYGRNTKYTTEELKEIFSNMFDTNMYDFSQIEYIDRNTEVNVYCKKHGWFKKKPNLLLKGHCCNECGREERIAKRTMSNEQFIEKAIKVHGDKYIYTEVDMHNRDEKGRICIICPEHGEFW